MKITLIGDSHFNVFERRRKKELEEILEEENPEFVTLECDPKALELLVESENRIGDKMEELGLDREEEISDFKYMHIGECMHAIQYCVARDILYQPVDMFGYKMEVINSNLATLFSCRDADEYFNFKNNFVYERQIYNFSLDSEELAGMYKAASYSHELMERDAIMSNFIREIGVHMRRYAVCHVGSKIHLVDVKGSLYDNLRVYNPKRLVLE